MIAGSLTGMDVWVARPPGYEPAAPILEFVEATGRAGSVQVTDSLDEALADADVVYANTFHSMGTKNLERRVRDFGPYQINEGSMAMARPDAIFMHCLPGYRGEEMTDAVIEGPNSVVFDQAENRLHTEKAILCLVLQGRISPAEGSGL
jgi:ornithine carbamoyltransferase